MTAFFIMIFAVIHAFVQASVKVRGEKVAAASMEQRFRCLGAMVDRLRKTSFYQERIGNVGRKIVEGTIKVGNLELKFLTAMGAGLTFAFAGLSIWNLIEFAEADDDDAAAFSGVEAFALVGLSGAILFEAGATFLGLGPIGWAFLALSILAGVIVYLVIDTPLEKWAKHGPYALEEADRNTQEYAGATPRQIYESLISLLMSPSVSIQRGRDGHGGLALVDVRVPGFAKGRDVLEVQTTLEPWWVNARGQGGHSEGPQQAATPISITELWDEDTKAFLGYRYTYCLLDARRTIVRACARRIVEGDIMLPAPPPGEPRTTIAEGIPEEANGWACAGPVRMLS